MNDIEASCRLDATRLSQRDYTMSLIRQACRQGLLTEEEVRDMKRQLLELVAERTEAWNHGESSSVRIEQAQDFLESILFVMGLQLKAESSADRALETLKTEPVRKCFAQGTERVKRKIAISRLLQRRMGKNLFPSKNIFFRETFTAGIDGFFRLYDPAFAAHDIHITADYPLCAGRPDLQGIEFIEQYLSCGEAENLFLCTFDPDRVDRLLTALTPGYGETPMNPFEPVFLTALGLVLTDGDPESLHLTDENLRTLYRIFSGRNGDETERILQNGLARLKEELVLPKLALEYSALCIPFLTSSVVNGIPNHSLNKVFLKMT